MKLFAFITLLILLLVLTIPCEAQIPRTISYQGVLTDNQGNPKPDAFYSFTFRLYNSPTASIVLWSEAKSIQTRRGLFYTVLGDQTSSGIPLAFEKQYWLGIQVGSDPELSPRIALTSAAYSVNSLRADTARFATNVNINPESIDSTKLARNSITNEKIKDGSITQSKLSPNLSIPPGGTATGDLTGIYPSPKIAPDVIDSSKIKDGSISSIDIVSGAITQAKLADLSITNSKIAVGAVTTDKIADANVTANKIADNAVTTTKLSEQSVNTGKIIDGAITNTKLANQTVTGEKIQSYTIQSQHLSPNVRVPNADSLNGIVAFRNQTPNSLYPLDRDGAISFVSPGFSGNSLSPLSLSKSRSNSLEQNTIGPVALFLGGLFAGEAFDYGVKMLITKITGIGVSGEGGKIGIEGKSNSGIGIYGMSSTGLAGKFDGNVNVLGELQMTGFKFTTNSQNGYVLTSDANGVGTWQAPSDGGPGVKQLNQGTGIALSPNPITTSGTISIVSNGVTSSMILDGTIVGSDISTSTTISTRNFYGTGTSSSYGIEGYSSGSLYAGVLGKNTNSSGTGVVGWGNNISVGTVLTGGSGGSFTGTQYGVAGWSKNTSGQRAGGYFDNNSGQSYAYVAAVTSSGTVRKIEGNGTVNTVMQTRSGVKSLFAPESPEAWIEDYGRGQLVNGHLRIELDPLFIDCVATSETMPLNVFITLNDDCNGVYVRTDATGFDVHELKSGASNAKFTYKVVGKWKGYESERFPEPLPRLNTMQSAPTLLER